MAEERFTSQYDGTTQDNLLEFAENVKEATTVDGAETVNVQGFTLPRISDISGFVAVNNAGNAIGFMSKEQVASVLGELILKPHHTEGALAKGGSLTINWSANASICLLSLYVRASNTEYMAVYILNWASQYAAGVNLLSEYSYTKNVTMEVKREGTDLFKIQYVSGNVESVTVQYSLFRIL